MDRKTILERLGQVIDASATEEVSWSQVTEDTELESFGFDSLSVLDLIFDIEQELGVEIPAEEILQMSTVGELVSYLAVPANRA